MKKLVVAGLLFLSTGLQAYFYSEPGDIGFFGEWIYFQPKFDDAYFVADTQQFPTGDQGTRIKNNPHYHSGFRAGAYYGFCNGCTDLIVRYTQLNQDYSKSAFAPGAVLGSGEVLFPTVGNISILSHVPGFAAGAVPFASAVATSSFNYYSGEALISQRMLEWSSLAFNIHGGAHYASLSNHNRYDFTTAAGAVYEVKEKTWFWGVGPQLGLDLNYYLCCDFSIVGRASTALLIGRSHSSTQSTAFATPASFIVGMKNEPDWRFVPQQNYRLGLNYYLHPRCWFMRLNLEVGYEFTTYFRAFDTIVDRGDPGAEGSLFSFDTFSNIGMNGPYVNLIVSF